MGETIIGNKYIKIAFFGLLIAALLSVNPGMGGGEEKNPTIRIQTLPDEYLIKAEMVVPSPPDTVYRIITDYESIDDHMKLFKVSRIILRNKNTVHIHQVHVLEVLFWEYQTESYLEVEETPNRGFSFREMHGSYKNHRGSWTLTPENNNQSTLMQYEVQAVPDFYVPAWLVTYFMKQEVEVAFNELYHWITNGPKPPVESP